MKVGLLLFAIWTGVGLLMVAQSVTYSLLQGTELRLAANLAFRLSDSYAWALLTPILLWAARKVSWKAGSRLQTTILVLSTGLLVAPAHRTLALTGTSISLFAAEILDSPGAYINLTPILSGSMTSFLWFWVIFALLLGWNYYAKFRRHQLRTVELERQLAQARLTALRSQLHPHFLFNALNTVSTLIDEDVARAQKVLARLGDLLRLALEEPAASMVPLARELEFVRLYLAIEQARFEDRLGVTFKIDAAALEAPVPPFILQPLVENAVRHGIGNLKSGGEIRVAARQEHNSLTVRIADNGPGIAPAQELSEGVGLRNTRTRLKHLYGDTYRFHLANRPEGGFEVAMRLPTHV